MRRVASPLSAVALGILVFAAWMHSAVLWPGNVGWLLTGDDRGQAAIGLLAYLNTGGPGLREPLLSAPEGMTLLFTDSVPLLGIMLKPFAPWLGAVQFVGVWYLACCLLQAGFAALLVRRSAVEPLAGWLGAALLAFFPALLNRYGHASLCAQWLLLWALWIFVEPRRAANPLWWTAVLAVAASVHSYLLLMVAAFWGSAVFHQLWQGDRRGRVLLGAAGALVPAVVLMALNGAFGGPYASTGTYGQFPAALDAWWNPANPGYTALPISSPAMPQGRGFEGFNYLGVGLIALVLIAGTRLAMGVDAETRRLLRRLAWLLPAFGVLALLAIGPAPVWRGVPLFELTLPHRLIDALDPVRASGRLLWPVTYTLAFAAIVIVARTPRATVLLAATLALQLIDLAPMIGAVRQTSARANDARVFTRTRDPRWAALIGQAGDIAFVPARPFLQQDLVQEVSWRAVAACRPVRFAYSSREALATHARLAADARDFAAGRLSPNRLYVLLDGSAPAEVRGRVRYLDGVAVIPPIVSTTRRGC